MWKMCLLRLQRKSTKIFRMESENYLSIPCMLGSSLCTYFSYVHTGEVFFIMLMSLLVKKYQYTLYFPSLEQCRPKRSRHGCSVKKYQCSTRSQQTDTATKARQLQLLKFSSAKPLDLVFCVYTMSVIYHYNYRATIIIQMMLYNHCCTGFEWWLIRMCTLTPVLNVLLILILECITCNHDMGLARYSASG